MPIDKILLRRKLKLLRADLDALSKIGQISLGEYLKNSTISCAIERLLEKIINRAIDINTHILVESDSPPPDDYYQSFVKLSNMNILERKFAEQLAKSTGLRNRLAHEYDEINPKMVYQSIADALKYYPKYIKFIVNFLDKQ